MGSLTLRGLDDRVIEALRRRARSNARSLEAEASELLASAVARGEDRDDKWALVARIAEMTPRGTAQTDSVVLLREDRDR